ncbi:MAG: HAD family phosphatase [Corynebacterium sp.]|nr:HAD family phosphatase [Corynebacterium sp.]
MLKAISWDMDGTLVNTEPQWTAAAVELSRDLGKELSVETQEELLGAASPDIIAGIIRTVGDENLNPEALEDELHRRVLDKVRADCPFMPGIQALLGHLVERGLPMALSTNTPREVTDPMLDIIGRQYFRTSVCGDEVPQPKPAPDIYIEACRRLGALPSETIVFEDSLTGMRAATDAGCHVVGLPEPGTPAELIPEGVHLLEDLNGARSYEGLSLETLQNWVAEWE